MWIATGRGETGQYHTRSDRPSDDAWAIEHVGAVNGGRSAAVAAAVADGLGSKRMSRIGSRLAADIAVEELVTFARSNPLSGCDIETVRSWGIAQRIAARWKAHVKAHAESEGESESEYATTLVFALTLGKCVLVGKAGDSDVLIAEGSTIKRPLPTPPGQPQNLTDTLVGASGRHHLKLSLSPWDVDGVLLTTDGIEKAVGSVGLEGLLDASMMVSRAGGVHFAQYALDDVAAVAAQRTGGDDTAAILIVNDGIIRRKGTPDKDQLRKLWSRTMRKRILEHGSPAHKARALRRDAKKAVAQRLSVDEELVGRVWDAYEMDIILAVAR